MPFSVDLHEDLVEVPLPADGLHSRDPAFPDLGGEHRAEPVPPVPDRFVTDFDTAFVEQILYVAEREREPNVEHHRQANDLWAGFEALEGRAFRHDWTLVTTLPRLKLSLSDNAPLPDD
jgi:hypothetical protein